MQKETEKEMCAGKCQSQIIKWPNLIKPDKCDSIKLKGSATVLQPIKKRMHMCLEISIILLYFSSGFYTHPVIKNW